MVPITSFPRVDQGHSFIQQIFTENVFYSRYFVKCSKPESLSLSSSYSSRGTEIKGTALCKQDEPHPCWGEESGGDDV